MARLSKYYKVTNQMMIEYISDYYNPDYTKTETLQTERSNYYIYEGLDGKIYYIDIPQDPLPVTQYKPTDPFNFIKFGDKSDSEYTYFLLYGAPNEDNPEYYNNYKTLIEESLNPEKGFVQHCSLEPKETSIYYDKIRVHFIYGFQLDTLAGFTLQVKTTGKVLKPIQKIGSRNRYMTDSDGNPVFETIKDINEKELEPLTQDRVELTMLDIFFPKEKIIYNVEWHKTPIYQNGSFYDRYIEFKVPSAYYMQLQNINFATQSIYGCTYCNDEEHVSEYIKPESGQEAYIWYQIGDEKYKFPRFSDEKLNEYYDKGKYEILPKYAIPAQTVEERYLTPTVMNDPNVIINFATVKEENAQQVTGDDYIVETFIQDPINQISMKYNSNSDLFNVRLIFDDIAKEVVYYPVFGVGADAVELDYNIMKQIETGAIPMITEAFMDQMENSQTFYEEYGDEAYKWIIYNELDVTYEYIRTILNGQAQETDTDYIHQHFANIIDYGVQNPDIAGPFWRSTYTPRSQKRINLTLKGVQLEYTCRLINRMNNVEAIRRATLLLKPENIIQGNTRPNVNLQPIKSFKIVNRIVKNDIQPKTTVTQSTDKIIRSYYDATNLVIKDMGGTGLYTQGQMTLFLKHTTHNYMFRLYTLNADNIRIPFDLTGPYKYKLVFPTLNGTKIQIMPNTDSGSLNLGIGQLVFHITEEQVRQIMKVPVTQRYFAIMTDTENKDMTESTLYEGKVAYYS